MASDFHKYLAAEIISEQRTLSYRNVSRALKVHVSGAKCLLYDFYKQENKNKPGSLYATYLIAGIKRAETATLLNNGTPNGGRGHDEDNSIPGSSPPPFSSSMLDPSQEDSNGRQYDASDVPVFTITLVREERLEDIKKQYEKITSLHLYSLSPCRIPDLVALTDVSRQVTTESASKDGIDPNSKTYGIIQNPGVRRRKGKRPMISETPVSRFIPTKKETKTADVELGRNVDAKKDESSRPSSQDGAPAATSKPANLKRDGSDFFKTMAKNKIQPKLEREDTDVSINASASGADDTKMTDGDEEGESEDEALFLDTGTKKPAVKKRQSDVKKEREDKAAKLRKMMDSDDEDESAVPNVEDASGSKDAPVTSKKGGAEAETHNNADEGVNWSDSDTERERKNAVGKDESLNREGEQIATSSIPQKRRGKRKVMKKRTMKDEEGFLVTKEEAVWESFSEDEPEPVKEKPKNITSLGSSGKNQTPSQSQKGSAGKGGKGGNIMSFFGKK